MNVASYKWMWQVTLLCEVISKGLKFDLLKMISCMIHVSTRINECSKSPCCAKSLVKAWSLTCWRRCLGPRPTCPLQLGTSCRSHCECVMFRIDMLYRFVVICIHACTYVKQFAFKLSFWPPATDRSRLRLTNRRLPFPRSLCCKVADVSWSLPFYDFCFGKKFEKSTWLPPRRFKWSLLAASVGRSRLRAQLERKQLYMRAITSCQSYCEHLYPCFLVHKHAHTHAYLHVFIHMHAHTHAHLHVFIHMHAHTCVLARFYSHTCTHMRTCAQSPHADETVSPRYDYFPLQILLKDLR